MIEELDALVTCENHVKILIFANLEKKSQDLCYSIVF